MRYPDSLRNLGTSDAKKRFRNGSISHSFAKAKSKIGTIFEEKLSQSGSRAALDA